MKMYLKMSSAKWRPFCPGEDELIHVHVAQQYFCLNGYRIIMELILKYWKILYLVFISDL